MEKNTELFVWRVFDKNGVELPLHYSGRLRTEKEANILIRGLNKHGKFAPYKKKKID